MQFITRTLKRSKYREDKAKERICSEKLKLENKYKLNSDESKNVKEIINKIKKEMKNDTKERSDISYFSKYSDVISDQNTSNQNFSDNYSAITTNTNNKHDSVYLNYRKSFSDKEIAFVKDLFINGVGCTNGKTVPFAILLPSKDDLFNRIVYLDNLFTNK